MVGLPDPSRASAFSTIEPIDQSGKRLSARQLALYIERGAKPRRIDPVARIGMMLLSRCFNWRIALVLMRPETLNASGTCELIGSGGSLAEWPLGGSANSRK